MSTHSGQNTPISFSEELPVPSPESEHEIISPQAPFHLTAESELIDDKQGDIKTVETQENDITEDEHTTTKRSRELKSLLALSKEANLDVNISHKRKSLDTLKLKEIASPSTKLSNEFEPTVKKNKIDKFPITAESEIENMTGDCNSSTDTSYLERGKKEDGFMGEERKQVKDVKVFKPNKDMYCWRCHREGVNISCETCPRSYHQKCLKQTISDIDNWPCPECVAILKAESTQTRSPAMKGMTLEHLCSLLKFAVKRMIQCNGSEPFHHPVNDKLFPEYKKYIIQPMNLKLLEKNIKENLYGSTHAFEADAKWILHNSIIFNSYQSKLTTNAKSILKICKQEMAEIENCPSCYLNANTKKSTWFVEVCPKPHILVWAKLKGFPYWPAKAMCTNSAGMVDVRFFGAHDRAWVPSKECFLYSRRDPNSNKQKRNDIIECMREVEVYIANIKALYGEFNYAPFKMQYDPEDELKQLSLFIPRYKPNAPPPKKRLKSLEPKVKVKKGDESEEHEDIEQVEGSKELLEGYGTDDEILGGEYLDTSKRNILRQQVPHSDPNEAKLEPNTSDGQEEEEDMVEPEMDDDTQLPSNIPEDKLPRGSVRTRGGLNTSPGKLKIIPRRISEENTSRKRFSPEELSPPSKIARRNSDQSIKSDSSRLSSLSDKINRVDISENVELTLGNTSDSYITSSTIDLETRKKPVQVEVDNSELSISPQSKTKISDRLMQKLSSSDEDVSQSKANDKDSDAELQTNIILEKYKDLVKKKSMEYSNEEASTSFGTTSVVSKEVCVSSDDVIDKNVEETGVLVNDEEKSVSGLIEEPSGDKEIENNDMDISSTENLKNNENEVEIENIEETYNIKEPEKNLEEQVPIVDDKGFNENITPEDITEEENSNEGVPVVSQTVGEAEIKKDSAPERMHPEKVEKSLGHTVDSQKIKENAQRGSPPDENERIEESNKTGDADMLPCEQKASKPTSEKIIADTKVQNAEKAKSTPGILIKNKINADKSEESILKNESPKVENTEKLTVVKVTEVRDELETMGRPGGKKIITYSRKDRKSSELKRKESPVIEQPSDSNSSDDQGLVLDDTQIDETNIRNIIHSSLNHVPQKPVIPPTETVVKAQKRKVPSHTLEESSNRKIKIKKDEKTVAKKESTFKIVPIQHILNKNIDDDTPEPPVVASNPILLKKLSQPRVPPAENALDLQSLECVEIKSEPESEDESQEFQYMEAKRKYLSALNISEKTEEVPVPKKNEIRTRSKTEEMGKGKLTDNLSKVIDEVATTFSAKHETQKKLAEKKTTTQTAVAPQPVEERRKPTSQENGEIFVKSFAKMSQPHARTPQRSLPTQKTKPSTSTNKPTIVHTVRREMPPKHNAVEAAPQTSLTKIAAPPVSSTNTSVTSNTASATNNKTLESLSAPGNVLILTQPGVILPTSQPLTYNAGSFVTFVPSQQNVAMMQNQQVINTMMVPPLHQNDNVQSAHSNLELNRSQNFIPQNEEQDAANRQVNPPPLVLGSGAPTNHVQNRDIPSLIPIGENEMNGPTTSRGNTAEARTESTDDEFSLLHSMVPESVSKAISEVLCRPPPKLKPRPPGPLSQVFDSGTPSSAGAVSAKINSISHRLGDYFRGMLVEMLEDLSKTNNPEATIASLKHEIETLRQKHESEMMDVRKNVCTILKDIQGSIIEERERLIDETRSACEVEALRRIEEAKSKQWCANCGKEAQFYCCWNTSYCDYTCQLKQWSKHMSKCTQHAGQSQPGQSPAIRPQGQLTFRPANAKGFPGKIVARPAKVYLNRTTNSKTIQGFKTGSGHLTLVDPSNLEILTNAQGTKFIASSSLLTRVRNVNSTVTSPSNGSQQIQSPSQRNKVSAAIARPSPSTSNNVSSVISDEEMDSD